MLREVILPTGESLIVEVEKDSFPEDAKIAERLYESQTHGSEGAPDNAERVTAVEAPIAAAVALQKQIEALGRIAKDAMNSVEPEEVHLEAHIKFSGDTKIIPFLVSAKGEGGLKVKLVWKNDR